MILNRETTDMAKVEKGRFTAKMDEPFVVFIIGVWLPNHK
jgi:hypothetical protein